MSVASNVSCLESVMADCITVTGSSFKRCFEPAMMREEYEREGWFNGAARRMESNTADITMIDDTPRLRSPLRYVTSISGLDATMQGIAPEVQSQFTTSTLAPNAHHSSGPVVEEIEYKTNSKAPEGVTEAESTSYETQPTIPDNLEIATLKIMANCPNLEQNYDINEKLGSGGYGMVYACKNKTNGQAFVVKVPLPKQNWWLPKDTKAASTENTVLSVLKHDNIVAIRDVFEYKDDAGFVVPILVFDFAAGGDLYSYVHHFAYDVELLARPIFKQLVKGLEYIHQQGFVHGDLKPSNVLVFSRSTGDIEKDPIPMIKISDFGCAQKMDEHGSVRYPPASRYFCPPELHRAGRIIRSCAGVSSELWSLGCTLYYLLTKGLTCFVSLPVHTVYDDKLTRFVLDMKNGWYRWPANNEALHIRNEAKLLTHALLDMDPAERMSLNECESHPWVIGQGKELMGRAPDRLPSTRGFEQRWWLPDTEARFLRVTNPLSTVDEVSESKPESQPAQARSSPVITTVRDDEETEETSSHPSLRLQRIPDRPRSRPRRKTPRTSLTPCLTCPPLPLRTPQLNLNNPVELGSEQEGEGEAQSAARRTLPALPPRPPRLAAAQELIVQPNMTQSAPAPPRLRPPLCGAYRPTSLNPEHPEPAATEPFPGPRRTSS